MEDKLLTKDNLVEKLYKYATNPDDFNSLFKERIKTALLQCPELLFAIDNPDYAGELFDDDGNINYEGEWSLYFGDNIRPYLFIPEVQDSAKNFVCYKVEFTEIPRYNGFEKMCQIIFVVICDNKNIIDTSTGIARHDLIGSILRERFNWSNIFGTQCKLVSNKEGLTDTNYITRTIILELTLPNEAVQTINGVPRLVNNVVRR